MLGTIVSTTNGISAGSGATSPRRGEMLKKPGILYIVRLTGTKPDQPRFIIIIFIEVATDRQEPVVLQH